MGGSNIILCECSELVKEDTFKAYIKTSANPSTRTIGRRKCGIIFNFIDDESPKKYSSRKELKFLAAKFANKNELLRENVGKFLLEVDRLKSSGRRSDSEILIDAYRKILESKNPAKSRHWKSASQLCALSYKESMLISSAFRKSTARKR